MYADANTRAIAQVERLASSFAPDCEWRRGPAFTYTTSRDAVASVRAEVEAAEAAGLAATFTTESDLPFPIAGAVRLDDQAHFHPRRYCLGLAAEVSRAGGVHPHTRVRTINDSDEGVQVVTERGTIRAGWVVIATHLPFGTTGGAGGEFNLFVGNAGKLDDAPTGTNVFTLTTNNKAGNRLLLTRFAPAAA